MIFSLKKSFPGELDDISLKKAFTEVKPGYTFHVGSMYFIYINRKNLCVTIYCIIISSYNLKISFTGVPLYIHSNHYHCTYRIVLLMICGLQNSFTDVELIIFASYTVKYFIKELINIDFQKYCLRSKQATHYT
mgnify:CR=1 FL=1